MILSLTSPDCTRKRVGVLFVVIITYFLNYGFNHSSLMLYM